MVARDRQNRRERFWALHSNGPEGARSREGPSNRTADTGIFRASKINKLLIMLKQGFFDTVGDSYFDSVC